MYDDICEYRSQPTSQFNSIKYYGIERRAKRAALAQASWEEYERQRLYSPELTPAPNNWGNNKGRWFSKKNHLYEKLFQPKPPQLKPLPSSGVTHHARNI